MLFICYPKCTTCQKAQKFLDDNKVSYTLRNIKEDNPTYEELKEILRLSKLPINKLFNTSGLLYKEYNLKDKIPSMSEDECLKLLATNGMLVKRPILLTNKIACVGFKEDAWLQVIKK